MRPRSRFASSRLRLHAQLNYVIERAGLFELRLTIPDGLEITRVDSDKMEEYRVEDDTLVIALRQQMTGTIDVRVAGEQDLPADGETFDLPLLAAAERRTRTGNGATVRARGGRSRDQRGRSRVGPARRPRCDRTRSIEPAGFMAIHPSAGPHSGHRHPQADPPVGSGRDRRRRPTGPHPRDDQRRLPRGVCRSGHVPHRRAGSGHADVADRSGRE